ASKTPAGQAGKPLNEIGHGYYEAARGRRYYCHRDLAGRRIHYVVTPAGNLAPVCADDRECKPKGIPCYGHKPRLRRSPRTRVLKQNQGG
uniref:hypothetical protein n=1 Tax=Megasphaera elsdenii TaxID=907 RepID=UPI0040260AB3